MRDGETPGMDAEALRAVKARAPQLGGIGRLPPCPFGIH
jgi:hypothetical protein